MSQKIFEFEKKCKKFDMGERFGIQKKLFGMRKIF